MLRLIFALAGLALVVLPYTLACSCRPYTLQNAYCSNRSSEFLIQAVVVGKMGPLFPPDWPIEQVPEDQREFHIYNFGYMRYIVDVKEVYRGSGDALKPLSILEARIGGSLCGIVLDFGKTYVFSGGFRTNDDNEQVLGTGLCQYHAVYDAPVEIPIPSCPKKIPSPPGLNPRSSGDWGEQLGLLAGLKLDADVEAEDAKAHKRLTLLDLIKDN